MSINKIVFGIGLLSLMSFHVINVSHENKVYSKGHYYYSDNITKVNYKSQYNNLHLIVPEGFESTNTVPKFCEIPEAKPKEELLKIGTSERLSFFTQLSGIKEENYKEIKEKSSYTFGFKSDEAVLSPTDLHVTAISPNTKYGVIPSFDSYFSGEGVTVILEGNKCLFIDNDNLLNEYQIRIKLTNLSKTWQSIGHTISYKDIYTNRELFYTDFISENDYSFNSGCQIAVTGKTGSISEIEEKTSYVTITLEKRQNALSPWISMTFGEFYGIK